MKPTVINNSNSEHSVKPNQEQHTADNSKSNNPNNNVGGSSGGGGNDSRRFPQFRVSEYQMVKCVGWRWWCLRAGEFL